jgi:hypothetical protein
MARYVECRKIAEISNVLEVWGKNTVEPFSSPRAAALPVKPSPRKLVTAGLGLADFICV